MQQLKEQVEAGRAADEVFQLGEDEGFAPPTN